MHKFGWIGLGMILSLSAGSAFAAEEPAFDPAADCKAQPWGETRKFAPGQGPDEFMPELKPTVEPEYLPAEMMKDFFIETVGPVLGHKAEEMHAAMTGLCISKQDRTLHVSLYFKEPYALKLKSYQEAWNMESYEAHFPKLLRLKVEKWDNWIEVYFSGRYLNTLRMLSKLPVLSDWVYLHRMTINTDTHWIRIGAGKLKDKVKIVAWTQYKKGGRMISKLRMGSTLGRLFRRGW